MRDTDDSISKNESPGISGGFFRSFRQKSGSYGDGKSKIHGFVENKQNLSFFFVYLANMYKMAKCNIIQMGLNKKKKGIVVMVVCVHGEVSRKFCDLHDMEIMETYDGNLGDYTGDCPVIVTGMVMSRMEYDRLKCDLFSRGYELVSTVWVDDELIVRLLRNQIEQRMKRGGRQIFGFYRKNGIVVENPAMIAVARRIIELRDAGLTLKQISQDQSVRRPDGTRISISTIQVIVKNREIYCE